METESSRLEVYRKSRRARERAFRKRLLLEAAEEVFSERGYANTSVEQVALRAGVAVQTLYNLFGNKEGLFSALVAFRQDEFLDRIRACSQQPTSRAAIEAIVDQTFAYFDEHRRSFRIYLGATHGFPWHVRSSLGERAFARYRAFLDLIEQILVRGMKRGEWPKEDPASLAAALGGMLNGLLTRIHAEEASGAAGLHAGRARRYVLRLLGARAEAEE